MQQPHKTDIVLSLKGRDAGALLLVIAEDETYLYLADGKLRRVEKPKRKKRIHVSFQGTCDAQTLQKLQQYGRFTNSDIRKALALWAGEPVSD